MLDKTSPISLLLFPLTFPSLSLCPSHSCPLNTQACSCLGSFARAASSVGDALSQGAPRLSSSLPPALSLLRCHLSRSVFPDQLKKVTPLCSPYPSYPDYSPQHLAIPPHTHLFVTPVSHKSVIFLRSGIASVWLYPHCVESAWSIT